MDLFEKYIPNASLSIFRFEGLQDYSGQDSKMLDEYLKTGNTFDPRSSKWWVSIKEKNDKGVSTYRVRLAIKPFNDYTKMELDYLKKAAEFSGEDIRVIEDAEFRKVSSDTLPDFYLIDDKYLFLMEYGDKGKYIKSSLVEDLRVKEYIAYKEKLLSFSYKLC